MLPLFKEINNHAISSLLNCILQVANCMVCKLYHNRILKIMKAYSCPVLSDLAVYVEEDSIQQLSFHLPLPSRHIFISFYVQSSMCWDHWCRTASWLGEERKKGLSCVCPCAFWEWQPMLARVWDGGEVVLVRRLLRLHFQPRGKRQCNNNNNKKKPSTFPKSQLGTEAELMSQSQHTNEP